MVCELPFYKKGTILLENIELCSRLAHLVFLNNAARVL
jgi:hypothetical protein